MPSKADFFLCQGNREASKGFLLEYQRCVLLALEKEGILDQEQLKECVIRLEKQYH